jgi:16S rRNA (uracil1498-N3)-methyltransferase
MSLENFVKTNRQGSLGIAHCYPFERLGIHQLKLSGSYTFLVGPEGDFTEEELAKVLEAGYLPFHLGDSRLRTETAALYLTTAISLRHL